MTTSSPSCWTRAIILSGCPPGFVAAGVPPSEAVNAANGLFHVFNDDDRHRDVEGLATILKPGGRLFLMRFSDAEPGTQGPRRVSAKEIRDAFAEGWKVESIEAVRFEVRPDFKDFTFSEGGPKAWFVVVRKAMV